MNVMIQFSQRNPLFTNEKKRRRPCKSQARMTLLSPGVYENGNKMLQNGIIFSRLSV